MDRGWYWKAGFIVAVTLVAIWALVPSVTYFRLPASERNEANVFEKARPKWAPAKHLNLGLDLQGGIHLVMGVDVDSALKSLRRAFVTQVPAESVAAIVQRAHHRHARVLVGLERGQRIEDERDFHGSGLSGGAAIVPYRSELRVGRARG